ncbi:UNVERIFIED_CONTAM: hypothetical protein H355_002217 [Colinus virginianus]|nr:hypothetical protein H355_002217 [Colinus virginianus]
MEQVHPGRSSPLGSSTKKKKKREEERKCGECHRTGLGADVYVPPQGQQLMRNSFKEPHSKRQQRHKVRVNAFKEYFLHKHHKVRMPYRNFRLYLHENMRLPQQFFDQEGKTDYAARRALVLQDRNKYNSHKHRLVVRLTNKRIICQIVYATVEGDRVVCAAESTELPRYGVKLGLTNYAAAYCTGLLLARRLLHQLGLSEAFVGLQTPAGEEFHIEENAEDRRPFKALLDVGIVRTTVGNRVFGAMKGAVDGGLHVPHSVKRFPGYKKEEGGEGSYDAEAHRRRIFGLHVAEYMRQLQEEDPEKYNTQFSQYVKEKLGPDDIENMYKEAHKRIRANPEAVKKPERKNPPQHVRQGNTIKTSSGQYVRHVKLTKAQRRERVQKKSPVCQQSPCVAVTVWCTYTSDVGGQKDESANMKKACLPEQPFNYSHDEYFDGCVQLNPLAYDTPTECVRATCYVDFPICVYACKVCYRVCAATFVHAHVHIEVSVLITHMSVLKMVMYIRVRFCACEQKYMYVAVCERKGNVSTQVDYGHD